MMETDWTKLAGIIAEICHEANRAYCKARMADDSQPSWNDAPSWQKESAIAGVMSHVDGALRQEPLLPFESHFNWMEKKAADGWKYGPVKDAEKKEHPCMVPYKELPQAQRVKDELFCAIASKLVEVMG